MKLKKIMALGLATVMTAGMLVGCSSKPDKGTDEAASKDAGKVFKIGMVTDVGGVNDQSFNQSAWEGLEKLQEEIGKDKIEVKYKESKQAADYAPNLDAFVDDEYDLIIGIGFLMTDDIKKAAKAYPEQEFALVDGSYAEGNLPNVTTLGFEDNVSAYMTGLIAARMTETNKVGFIGGVPGEVIDRFEYGFRAGVKDGVKEGKPEAEVKIQYANSFDDVAKGRAIASQMHSDGVDIIFTAAGAVGNGSIEVAKENNKKAIGVDKDQNILGPDHVITSAMKRVDSAVYNIGKNVVEGTYKGGQVVVNTLAMEGVGIAPTSDKNVPPDVLKFVTEESEKIKSGDIKVPQNKEEFEAKYK
ncbi:MAG: BMP family ABC transporter substrate-binding protein [Romboutsia sp.]